MLIILLILVLIILLFLYYMTKELDNSFASHNIEQYRQYSRECENVRNNIIRNKKDMNTIFKQHIELNNIKIKDLEHDQENTKNQITEIENKLKTLN